LLFLPAMRRDGPFAARPGTVYLVGAGPGDPGLLTIRGRDLLASAGVVLYDHLVDPRVVALASRAERIGVGKIGHGASARQEDIHDLMIERARAGKAVVRLKGGDPLLFGRGAEEMEALAGAGVPWEIVPGVSSALAAPAAAGIALTHRSLASSVAIVTAVSAAHGRLSPALAIAALADSAVVLMGMSVIGRVAAELITRGRRADTPAAVVSSATLEGQRSVEATLGTIAAAVQAARLEPPGVLIVGEAVRLAVQLRGRNAQRRGRPAAARAAC
jgi:uroporphyrin-III C-methyltransferase